MIACTADIGQGAELEVLEEKARRSGATGVHVEDLRKEFVTDYARTVAGNAPLTIKSLKIIIGEVLKDAADRDLDLCRRLVDDCFASADYIEGRRAFTEKRPPRFEGR